MTGAVKIPSLTLKWSPPPGVMVRVSVKVMYLSAPCDQQDVSDVSPEVVSDGLAEEHIKSQRLPHVARAGELSLEAGVAGQLVHVAIHHPGREVVLPSDHVIPRHRAALSPELVTRALMPLVSAGVP